MSKRSKQKRRERYYANVWRCPGCKGFNRRDYEGLDTCEHCGRHTVTRYDLTRRNGRLFVTEYEELSEEEGPCWCGEPNPYYAPLPGTCGGSRTIDCHCGGDLCVCHWHGEVECFGCEDCQPSFDDGDEADDPDEDRVYYEQ